MERKSFVFRKVVFFVLIAAVAIIVFGGIVMLLWNNVLAEVLNISTITFGQALGLLVLSKILFGGWRGGLGWRASTLEKQNARKVVGHDPGRKTKVQGAMAKTLWYMGRIQST